MIRKKKKKKKIVARRASNNCMSLARTGPTATNSRRASGPVLIVEACPSLGDLTQKLSHGEGDISTRFLPLIVDFFLYINMGMCF